VEGEIFGRLRKERGMMRKKEEKEKHVRTF
jgi:hypothetical protein